MSPVSRFDDSEVRLQGGFKAGGPNVVSDCSETGNNPAWGDKAGVAPSSRPGLVVFPRGGFDSGSHAVDEGRQVGLVPFVKQITVEGVRRGGGDRQERRSRGPGGGAGASIRG